MNDIIYFTTNEHEFTRMSLAGCAMDRADLIYAAGQPRMVTEGNGVRHVSEEAYWIWMSFPNGSRVYEAVFTMLYDDESLSLVEIFGDDVHAEKDLGK